MPLASPSWRSSPPPHLALLRAFAPQNISHRLDELEQSIHALREAQERAFRAVSADVVARGATREHVNVNHLISSNRYINETTGRRRLDGAPPSTKLNGLKSVTITKDSGIQVTFNTLGWTKYDDGTVVIHGDMGRNLIYRPGYEPYLEEPKHRVATASAAAAAASRRRLQQAIDPATGEAAPSRAARRQLWWWNSAPPSPPPAPPPPAAAQVAAESSSELCTDKAPSLCRACVNAADPWCAENEWDENCKAVCVGKTEYSTAGCGAECSEQISDVSGELDTQTATNPAVDCVLSEWSAPGQCQFKSGSPTCFAERRRTILTHPQGGAACAALVSLEPCDCPAVCGDGHLVSPEECDDANPFGGDGCNAACEVEPGYACGGAPSSCAAAACGDGIRVAAEACDDGNGVGGDGCSAACEVEVYFDCDAPLGGRTQCECMRVRKDWNDLRDDERERYVRAVNGLKAAGVYDHFVATHAYAPNKDFAHGSSGFLPWHRKYLLEFENALRAVGPEFRCVTVPYWDWAEETLRCEADAGCAAFNSKSLILNAFGGPGDVSCMTAPHSGTVAETNASRAKGCHGKETWGSTGAEAKLDKGIPANAVGCVTSGPFANWMAPAYPETKETTSTCLSRGVNWDISSQGYLTGPLRLQEIITSHAGYGTTDGFRAFLEGNPHANPHNLLGGHIRSFSSPADPLFWSHHAFIDKIWDMWQNCHDYDEIPKHNLTASSYTSTGQGDGLDEDMPFGFPPATRSSGPTHCYPSVSACAGCVHANDGWCASNAWDDVCIGFCTTPCAEPCGAPTAPPQRVESFIATWDAAHATPRHYHSIHALGDADSYLYAPDELDARLRASSSICSFVETMHHGQAWKSRRRRRRAQAAAGLTPPCPPRAVSHCDNSCAHDADGACDDGGAGAEYAACDFATDCDDCGATCECAGGLMWSADYSGCVSIHWQHQPADEETVAASDYFSGLQDKLMADSIYVKPADKAGDVAAKMTRRECELLYNAKNGVVRIDDARTADSFTNRFLRGWNLTASIALGVVDDPCSHVVGR
ncbi:hypothetical protein AB1Y20_014314 [Prymnesium parvum]|uniref:Tyrosinase copper-binding domain-containing protein n=1 Tax=Prymnesium parvum TaxID=97485 RepID=A0AB34IDN4_PRYPA